MLLSGQHGWTRNHAGVGYPTDCGETDSGAEPQREASPTMKTLRCVGLDVHKDSIAIAVAEPEGGEPSALGTIPKDTRLLLQKLKGASGLSSVATRRARQATVCIETSTRQEWGASSWRRP